MSRNEPSVRTIRAEFRVKGGVDIGLEKAEELQGILGEAGKRTGLSPRDVLEITAINVKDGALERLLVMMRGFSPES